MSVTEDLERLADAMDPTFLPGYEKCDPPHPHEKQMAFHESKAKFRAFIGGRNSGKTQAGCSEFLKFMLDNPGCYGFIGAPTYPMLRDATRRTFLEVADPYIKDFYKGENRVELKNGAEAIFRSLDEPERRGTGRGPNFWIAWIDEAGGVLKKGFDIVVAAVRAGPKPNIFITSTPKGYNWIYDFWVTEKTEDRFYIHATPFDNPGCEPSYIEDLKAMYTGVFAKQEIYGEFVGFEGLVYPDFSTNIHVFADKDKPEFKEVLGAMDWGYTNPYAQIVAGLDYDNRLYIFEEIYEKGLDPDRIIELSAEMKQRNKISKYWADPSSPDYIALFNKNSMPCYEGNNKVLYGIGKVASRLKIQDDGLPRLFVHEKCVNLITEFQNYRYAEAKEGKAVQDNPLKLYDHLLDALRYLICGLDEIQEMTIIDASGIKF